MRFEFNARSVAPSSGREKWPDGWHKVVITNHDIKPTQNSKGQRLVFSIVGAEGPVQGKENEIGLNIQHSESPQAVEIAYSQLSSICWVVGKPAIQDLGELHGIPFWAMSTGFTDPNAQTNNWRGFKDLQGNDAINLAKNNGGVTSRGQAAPQQTAPSFGAPQGQAPQGQAPQGQAPQQFAQPGPGPGPGQQPGWGGGTPAGQPAQQSNWGQQQPMQQPQTFQQPAQQAPAGQPAWSAPSAAAPPAGGAPMQQGGAPAGWSPAGAPQGAPTAGGAPPWGAR